MKDLRLRKELGLTSEALHRLMHGGLTIDNRLALKLSAVIGGSSDFWLARQQRYSERSNVLPGQWMNSLPLTDMVRFGWVPRRDTKAAQYRECLAFFGARDVHGAMAQQQYLMGRTLFRQSDTFSAELGATSAWLQRAQHSAGGTISSDFSRPALLNALPTIRSLTREAQPAVFVPALQNICHEAGVRVIVERPPKGCVAYGAARHLDDGTAMILLSFRYMSDDQFWFAFFHEVGHLVLHCQDEPILETGLQRRGSDSEMEREANEFAGDVLIPKAHRPEFGRLTSNSKQIVRFARSIGVSPGIVVGQLRHSKLLGFGQQSRLIRRYSWPDNSAKLPAKPPVSGG
jgi:Zn-dependent peptidase ImmA (M78 family)